MKQEEVIEEVLSEMRKLSPDHLTEKMIHDWEEDSSFGLMAKRIATDAVLGQNSTVSTATNLVIF